MNRFKHANWWTSYLGELSKDFGRLQAWISSGNTSTSNGEEESRVKKTAAVFFRTLEALPEVHFFMLYTIWNLRKSRIQRFKQCMIWSWNEEDMAFRRQLHHAKWPISQGCENFARRFSSWCEIWPFRTMKKPLAKILQGGFRHIAKFLWIPCFETLLMLFHCRFSKIFCLAFSFVNTYFTLIINQWIGCFCNSSCNLACYCL